MQYQATVRTKYLRSYFEELSMRTQDSEKRKKTDAKAIEHQILTKTPTLTLFHTSCHFPDGKQRKQEPRQNGHNE